jgi:hypothetical protein
MACRIPVVVLHVRAEDLVELHAGIRDQIIHYRVEASVVDVDRLARQVADRVDQSLGRPANRLLLQGRQAGAYVAGGEVDDVPPAAVIGPSGDDASPVEGTRIGDLQLSGHEARSRDERMGNAGSLCVGSVNSITSERVRSCRCAGEVLLGGVLASRPVAG